jgi:hypothetical protein
LQDALATSSPESNEIKENIKKVARRTDTSRLARKENSEVPETGPPNDSMSLPRKIKKAEKQRRREEVLHNLNELMSAN